MVSSELEPDSEGTDQAHLSVHPSVVFKLGEDLITDHVQALIELVKNAYDADSLSARIEVDTSVWTDAVTGEPVEPPPTINSTQAEGSPSPSKQDAAAANASDDEPEPVETKDVQPALPGLIRVIDRGSGMTLEEIRRGWLTVSASRKRDMKARGEVTPRKKRTPLGDKGLGRLGAQRLGEVLEILTVPNDGSDAYFLQISWRAYESAESLSDVPLHIHTRPRGNQKPGTTITIRGLKELDRWRGDGLTDLERELSVMVSPYGHRGFDVRLRVDDEPVDLRRRSREVREKSSLRYLIDYHDRTLRVTGRISTAYFRPDAAKDQPEYRVLVEDDNGAAFRTWIQTQAPDRAKAIGLTAGDEHYFIAVSTKIRLDDMAGTSPLANGTIADPGPFGGEIDSVTLRTNPTDVFNTDAEYRAYVRKINGIRIYRDGFGIRTAGPDWLKLGEQWTTGSHFYNLRPDNVVGYIELSAEHNATLVETTNREHFQDTPSYRNFLTIMEAWRNFTETTQGLVRRQWVAYRKQHADTAAGPDTALTSDAIGERANKRLGHIRKSAAQSQTTRKALAKVVESVTPAAADGQLFDHAPFTTRAAKAAEEALDEVDQLSNDLVELSQDYSTHVAELEVLRLQVETVQEQLSDAWEAVSLGITAEALSHEVHLIADRLRSRSQTASRHLAAHHPKDVVLGTYIEHVRSSAAALNRQLAHLDPALRYMRERRTAIELSDAVAETAAYYTERWEHRRLRISSETMRDFSVTINAGKLSQVFDNLILNSEYWMVEQQRRGQANEGSLTITVEAPCVILTDTGPGVDPSVEDLLFEPFVTTKARGTGRGLGLFVVRQLLDTEGAEIELDPHRDPDGRRRSFRITFNPTYYGR